MPQKFSDAAARALLEAKKIAFFRTEARNDSQAPISVNGWDLLNGLYRIDSSLVNKVLEAYFKEQNLSGVVLPWIEMDDLTESSIQGKQFRVNTPIQKDYISRARHSAGNQPVKVVHLIEAVFSELDDSLKHIFDKLQPTDNIRDFLLERIIGQDYCIDALLEGLNVRHIRLDPKKPFSFAFLGPTGVGKTELVKQAAQFLFKSDKLKKHFLVLNMGRYQMETAYELIFGGSPYKGQPGEGLLYPFLKEISTRIPGTVNDYQVDDPYCIILLDEIEKAHPSTLISLLSMLEEGLVETIHKQRHFRFHLGCRSLIFLTANSGAALYDNAALGSRFLQSQELIKQTLQEESRALNPGARRFIGKSSGLYGFRPEFLGRIDKFVMFSKLQPSHVEKIVDLNLNILAEKVLSTPEFESVKEFIFDDAVKTLLAFRDGFQYGVRNLKTLIETTFLPSLYRISEAGLEKDVKAIYVQLKDIWFTKKMCSEPKRIKVLAIDDPDDLKDPEDYRNHFKDLGLSWDSASSVSAALGLLKKNRYLFVLMDLHPDVLYQIRRRFPDLPVFLFSEEATGEDIKRTLQAGGARDFLRKDLDEADIQVQISLFQQIAHDQARIKSMNQSLAGQANGFPLRLLNRFARGIAWC